MEIDTMPGGDATSDYSREVGRRLRRIRNQKRLSLLDVEQRSNQEFKASVLGAYERGERAVSVPRLDRLSQFYGVPIDQLLHRAPAAHRSGIPAETGTRTGLAIDVERLERLPGGSFETLTRYLRAIQVQRQDFGTDVVVVRSNDECSIAAMIDVPADGVVERLAELGVLVRDRA